MGLFLDHPINPKTPNDAPVALESSLDHPETADDAPVASQAAHEVLTPQDAPTYSARLELLDPPTSAPRKAVEEENRLPRQLPALSMTEGRTIETRGAGVEADGYFGIYA